MGVVIESLEEFPKIIGQHVGYSEYITVTQEQVNLFADATGDHQWIHVDVERAKTGPFGGPIAHGYLTLSLIPVLMGSIGMQVKGISMGVNYGSNKIRFPSPVPVGSRIRAGGKILDVTLFEGGAQSTMEVTIEVEGATKPSCVAEVLTRYYK
ncbi:MAG: MaoC family dehydratase [Actinomycetota bacterium]|jgi:acyl dehydratase